MPSRARAGVQRARSCAERMFAEWIREDRSLEFRANVTNNAEVRPSLEGPCNELRPGKRKGRKEGTVQLVGHAPGSQAAGQPSRAALTEISSPGLKPSAPRLVSETTRIY